MWDIHPHTFSTMPSFSFSVTLHLIVKLKVLLCIYGLSGRLGLSTMHSLSCFIIYSQKPFHKNARIKWSKQQTAHKNILFRHIFCLGIRNSRRSTKINFILAQILNGLVEIFFQRVEILVTWWVSGHPGRLWGYIIVWWQ